MEYLQNLLDQSQWPVLSAFIIGLMMAFSPCPLATNITAIAYIGKDLENRRKVFYNGLIYTLGRMFSYTTLGIAIYYGASGYKISDIFQGYGERLLGPVMIIIGILLLNVIPFGRLSFGTIDWNTKLKVESGSYLSMFLLGVVFALAFCPYSGVLYFLMLIPLTIESSNLLLPPVFSLATGLPVIILAWLIAFTLSGVGAFYNRIKTFELWFRHVVAILFIGTGAYFIWIFYF
ncbi:MAG: sulfite exporter TauE/SafE family protein [Bacteroidetes bacterium]|nr:MAG: sulfite exporter TauE/SafE family protein [Bacteroidota bacterium]RLD82654.1 MAG: sulfite exporter TauE/SafE family protein [Bacteroidota bacterium]